MGRRKGGSNSRGIKTRKIAATTTRAAVPQPLEESYGRASDAIHALATNSSSKNNKDKQQQQLLTKERRKKWNMGWNGTVGNDNNSSNSSSSSSSSDEDDRNGITEDSNKYKNTIDESDDIIDESENLNGN